MAGNLSVDPAGFGALSASLHGSAATLHEQAARLTAGTAAAYGETDAGAEAEREHQALVWGMHDHLRDTGDLLAESGAEAARTARRYDEAEEDRMRTATVLANAV
ncbi:hypothetical protein ACFOY4_35125 [Actinomadura syzygii]|uniref:Uncharacterized protein n=1 Tax=Actinomadura syzygii TaxID=1427538 RepID=A0A5D0TZE5_9ACTN|nr:hypothetical protein [Actinomadura syzygii]TYC11207.1 hypothetical protein FXF65_30160 [Actinomadura syzygii]